MVDTWSKTSKQGAKGRRKLDKNPSRIHDNSVDQSLGENLVDHSSTQQFITTEQLGNAHR